MEQNLGWPCEKLLSQIPGIPDGFEVGILQKDEIQDFIEKLKVWYPDISVGMESTHLNEGFYRDQCFTAEMPGTERNDILPVVVRNQGEIAAFVSFERIPNSLVLTSRLGVVAPQFRGAKIGHLGPVLLEHIAMIMGYEMIHYQATLKIPHQQIIAEKMGFKLVGILPGIDLDRMENGRPGRVYEAVYAKMLPAKNPVTLPPLESLTPKTKEFFEFIFGKL